MARILAPWRPSCVCSWALGRWGITPCYRRRYHCLRLLLMLALLQHGCSRRQGHSPDATSGSSTHISIHICNSFQNERVSPLPKASVLPPHHTAAVSDPLRLLLASDKGVY